MRLVFVLLFIPFFSIAQLPDNLLDAYMIAVKSGSFEPVPEDLLQSENESEILSALLAYQSDSIVKIRSKAYYMAKMIGKRSEKSRTRKMAIDQLVSGIGDGDAGISGNNIETLTDFGKDDFTSQHFQKIDNYVQPDLPHLDEMMKLVGYLEIGDSKEKLQEIVSSGAPFQTRWAARLALSRMGDQGSIDYVLGKIKNAPIDDNFMYDFVPDLVYTRQPDIFKFIEEIVQSDRKNCYSPDPDSSRKILCGYRAMEDLAGTIVDSPLVVDEFGELDIQDYEQTLLDLRVWFDQNESYDISRGTF